jgi:hypothetical protein
MGGYSEMTHYEQIDGPLNINKITWLADIAVLTFIRDRFMMVVVHGPGRLGKSSYVALSCAETYAIIDIIDEKVEQKIKNKNNKLEIRKIRLDIYKQLKEEHYKITPDWNIIRNYFVFKPRELIRISRKSIGKHPMVIQDDAGKWLNAKEHGTRFVKAVTKNFEVIGSKWGTMVFSCKNLRQLVSLARDDPDVYTIRIIDWAEENGAGLLPQRRIAKVHEGWESEDTKKSGKKWIDQNPFYAWMNDKFFLWYNPIRLKLCDEGYATMEKELDELVYSGDKQYE